MSASGTLLISRCGSCHGRFLPRVGPCPRCGASAVTPLSHPAGGVVIASVELVTPAAPWPSPHRLVLVELEESVRVLARATEAFPPVGARVVVRRDQDQYLV